LNIGLIARTLRLTCVFIEVGALDARAISIKHLM
jgi:hypothetical protein